MDENTLAEEEKVLLDVILYTSFRIVSGVLSLPRSTRLSDRMNDPEDDFLCITDHWIIDLQKGPLAPVSVGEPWFVHRQEIMLLHQVSSSQAEPSTMGTPEKRVPKRAVPIDAYVGPFRVRGDLYVSPDSDIATLLNHRVGAFFPMTSVQISLPTREDMDVVQAPFALINRNRLIITKQPPVVL
jgi:hypothetical protein